MRLSTWKAMFAVISLSVAGFAAEPAWSFKCQSGTVGQGSCSCSGTTDCTDMRHSKMCKSDLDCSQGKCSCTAARVADTGPTGGGVKPKTKLPRAVITDTAR